MFIYGYTQLSNPKDWGCLTLTAASLDSVGLGAVQPEPYSEWTDLCVVDLLSIHVYLLTWPVYQTHILILNDNGFPQNDAS
jgi:hypothetical protein